MYLSFVGVDMSRLKTVFVLLGVFFLYALVSVFTKYTSLQDPFSLQYFVGLVGAFGVMGVYAILWQQILRRIPLAEAYMFKGSSLIYLLFFSAILFGESITLANIVGSLLIVGGIALFAKA